MFGKIVVISERAKVISFCRHHPSCDVTVADRSTTSTTAYAEDISSNNIRIFARTRKEITFQLKQKKKLSGFTFT